MATESGWWNLSATVIPNEFDLEHIAKLIAEGFTSGEIVENEEVEEDKQTVSA